MKKILVIEDNAEIRENISEILELAKYNVVTAENGKEGVDIAKRETPDLVICDVMMPELDGYGVLHMFNKDTKLSVVPFIFVTAKADRADFRKGMEMGADDYITKPFTQIELLDAVESRLRKSELLKSEYALNTAGITNFLKDVKINGKAGLVPEDYEVYNYKKKQVIYSVGHRPSFLYYVAKGKIKTFKMNEYGKELITAIYKEGDFMGYTPLLEENQYLDTAEALDETEVMLIPKAEFLTLMYTDVQVARKFIKLLTANLTEREENLVNIAYNSLRKRVAVGLLQVYDKYKKEPGDKPELGVSREDLAQVVGTATESLVRVLSDFKSEKLIEIKSGKISVLNEGKLNNLLN